MKITEITVKVQCLIALAKYENVTYSVDKLCDTNN